MPYTSRRSYRRFSRRPRFGRRYGGFSTGSSRMGRNSGGVRGLARRVGRLAQRVGSPEVKFHDTPIVDTVINGDPSVSITDICDIPQVAVSTTSADSRVGQKVTLRSIQVSGYAQQKWGVSTLNGSVALRMVVYRDAQPNGSVPSPALILEPFSPLAIPGTPSLRNMESRARFMLLHDQRITLSQTGNSVFAINKYFKVTDNLTYGYQSTVLPESNTYGVMLINDTAVGSDLPTSLTWNLQCRIRFVDT